MKSLARRPPGTVKVHLEYASLMVWEEPGREVIQGRHYAPQFRYDILHPIIRLLRRRGWSVHQDKDILKNYRCLRNDRRHCTHPSGLECELNMTGRSFKIEFYQNVTKSEHPSGGKYEFSKYAKMPYLLKVRVRCEMQHFMEWFKENTEYVYPEPEPSHRGLDAVDVDTWLDHHAKYKTFERVRSIHSDEEISPYNSKCQDGVVHNHDRVYFMGYDKRWGVGTAEHNINNMWWVKVGTHGLYNIASFDLRHTVPEGGLRGRQIPLSLRLKRLETLMLQAAKERRYADAERMRRVFDWMVEAQQVQEEKKAATG